MGQIKFELAEVIGVNNSYEFIEPNSGSAGNADQLFSIQVQTVNRYDIKRDIRTAKPMNLNYLQIPTIGEHVLIFRAYNQETTLLNTGIQWYYFQPYAIQSKINSNIVPGISYRNAINTTDTEKVVTGRYFKLASVSSLQPYEGDILYQGRWGNTIRLGSTIQYSDLMLAPNWTSDNAGDPIIIISNGKKTTKSFTVEDIQMDESSLYLTSKQRINKLATNRTISSNISSISNFNKSQLIGVADRIILKSKTDSIIIDAKDKMELNAEKIYIGSTTNKEPMLHSTAVVKLLQKLIAIVKIGFADSSGVVCTPLYDSLPDADIEKLMKELTNENIMIDAYKSNNINT